MSAEPETTTTKQVSSCHPAVAASEEEESEQPTQGKTKRKKAKKSCINTLPLARVKRILKSDPDVKLISNDAALLVCRSAVRWALGGSLSVCPCCNSSNFAAGTAL